MLVQFAVGAFMIGLTVVFQAFALDFLLYCAQRLEKSALRRLRGLWQSLVLTCVVTGVFIILVTETWFWALLYFGSGAVPELESAIYFSISTFTTVGWGDIVLDSQWRILAAIESVNGFLMFGWATAFIFEVVNHIYRKW